MSQTSPARDVYEAAVEGAQAGPLRRAAAWLAGAVEVVFGSDGTLSRKAEVVVRRRGDGAEVHRNGAVSFEEAEYELAGFKADLDSMTQEQFERERLGRR
ncbi:hypothetical protein [Arthrobacter sp. UM1]|uniref:hypothetical protein n=1 Tax=Arthrobacter sp. UM1 TaxID=2766776 RepID=UPI001CF663F2|nr:hypothetical protein [Arthrobacter sp. UM1]MCB4207410.1 hypothetical protein [Arthrobacter sp. UM1]